MADALLSPAVGGVMWVASAATLVHCARRLRAEADDRRVPLMGVLGAFLFTAQMINFAIPGTGSSGHLAGGLLLAVLLGPHAAFVVMASVLVVQALFFADGGLLALGCNIFNLGFFPAFVGLPIYRWLCGDAPGPARTATAAAVAAVIALECGAFAVVLETVASGISALPFRTFVLFMLPIHLGIGLVEGLVTAAVVAFVYAARPRSIAAANAPRSPASVVLASLLCLSLVLGGVGAWYASERPDGLEWSIAQVTGGEELPGPGGRLPEALARLQSAIAVLPDYGFREPAESVAPHSERAATTVSGLAGGALALALAALVGLGLRRRTPQREA